MKKLILSLIFLALSISVLPQAGPSAQKKSFPIHTEKRMFIKKGDRHRHGGHHHHPKKNKPGDRKHFNDRHKK